MKFIFSGLVLTLLWLLAFMNGLFDSPGQVDLPSIFYYICFSFWGISLVGVILMLTGLTRVGGILVVAGAIIFIPLGIVTIIGVKKIMQRDSDATLEQRRELANEQKINS